MHPTLWLRRGRWHLLGLIAALGGLLTSASIALAVPGVTPASVSLTLPPGGSATIAKSVETPAIPPNPDIVFLVDTTTSMGPAIGNVQANLPSILNGVLGAQPSAQFAVAQYKDTADPIPEFSVLQNLTANTGAVQAGINSLTPLSGGGTDAAEDWINALYRVATGAIAFRPNGTPIVLLIGDATSHDPSNGISMAQAIAALQAAGIRVLAFDVGPTPGEISDGLNGTGQAGAVAAATGGQLFPGVNPAQASSTILAGLQNLPVTVTHSVGPCDPNLTVGLSPASQTITSGGTVTFTETIGVASGAPQAQNLSCTVNFLLNGNPAAGFTQQITIHVRDVTPPTIVGSRTPLPNGFGWNNSDVTVQFACADAESGIASCTPDVVLTAEGANQSVTGTAVDNEGNTATATVGGINIDKTAPLISGAPTTSPNANGWYNGPVTIHFTCSDALSGIATCPPDVTIGTEGANQSVSGTAVDRADNASTAVVSGINIDLTPPQASCAPTTNPAGNNVPSAGKNPKSGQNPDGFYELIGTDGLSGVSSLTLTDSGSTFVAGPFASGTKIKLTQAPGAQPGVAPGPGVIDWHVKFNGDGLLQVTDLAGNSASATCLVAPLPK